MQGKPIAFMKTLNGHRRVQRALQILTHWHISRDDMMHVAPLQWAVHRLSRFGRCSCLSNVLFRVRTE